MNPKRSFGDDVLTAAIAFGAGSLAGLPVSWLVGTLTFVVAENDCSGEYLCGVGAFLWAILIGASCGLVAFITVARRSLFKHRGVGERLRTGLLTFAVVPVALVLTFPWILGIF